MSKEICISSTPHETRLAILEDDQLTEVYYERENEYTLAGSIYKGRVTRVLPGMQSAFVDLGLERDAFLYVTDFMEEQEDSSDFERIPTSGRAEEGGEPRQQEPRQKEPRQQESRNPRTPAQSECPTTGSTSAAAPSGGSGRQRRPRSNGGGLPLLRVKAPAGEFEDGTRRWRGRRGRRKGFRPGPGGTAGQPGTGSPGEPPRGRPVRRALGACGSGGNRSYEAQRPRRRILSARGVAFEVRRSERAKAPDGTPQPEIGGSQPANVGILQNPLR